MEGVAGEAPEALGQGLIASVDFATAGEACDEGEFAFGKWNVRLVGDVDQLFYAVGIGACG